MSSVVYLPISGHLRLLLPLAASVRAASVTMQRRDPKVRPAREIRGAMLGGRPIGPVTMPAAVAPCEQDDGAAGRDRVADAATG